MRVFGAAGESDLRGEVVQVVLLDSEPEELSWEEELEAELVSIEREPILSKRALEIVYRI